MSTLANPHIIAGDFNASLYSFLKQREAFVPRVYLDDKNIPTLGVGCALAIRDQSTGLYQLRPDPELATKFGAMGITLTQADKDILNAAVRTLNGQSVPSGVPTIAHWNSQTPDPSNTPFSFGTITELQFQPLFNLLVADATAKLTAKIGQPTFSALAGSNEMVALLSLTFNSLSLIGPKLVTALQTGERAEAWFEIRYQSNKERLTNPNLATGIANRRYAESDKFGLYENSPLNDAEAKSIFRVYTAHRETILTYESDPRTAPSLTDSFTYESQGAKSFLVTTYAQFAGAPAIDGEVLVGSDFLRDDIDLQPVSIPGVPAHIFDLSKNDLILGEGGETFCMAVAAMMCSMAGSGAIRLWATLGTTIYSVVRGSIRMSGAQAMATTGLRTPMLTG